MFKKLWPTAGKQKPKIRTAFSKSGVVTKTFAPKLCAEWSDREVHSSHGDHFCYFFCVNVSEPYLGAKKMNPIPKNVVVAKLFSPKFCAEWSDREVHSSYGDYFCDNFCFYVLVTIFHGHRMFKKRWPTAYLKNLAHRMCAYLQNRM